MKFNFTKENIRKCIDGSKPTSTPINDETDQRVARIITYIKQGSFGSYAPKVAKLMSILLEKDIPYENESDYPLFCSVFVPTKNTVSHDYTLNLPVFILTKNGKSYRTDKKTFGNTLQWCQGHYASDEEIEAFIEALDELDIMEICTKLICSDMKSFFIEE